MWAALRTGTTAASYGGPATQCGLQAVWRRHLVWRRPESLRSLLGLSVSACYWLIGKQIRSVLLVSLVSELDQHAFSLLVPGLMGVT